jgi:hypothetical protein
MKITKSDISVLCAPDQSVWKAVKVTPTERRFFSFDPAAKNLAFRGEARWPDGRVEKRIFEKVSVEGDDKTNMFVLLDKLMDRLHDFLSTCHVILIEKQNSISSGGQVHSNAKVQRVTGFIVGILMARYGRCGMYPLIAEISPKLKGKVFDFVANQAAWELARTNAKAAAATKKLKNKKENIIDNTMTILAPVAVPVFTASDAKTKKGVTYAQTKTIGVRIALEILEQYKDTESLAAIHAEDKKDDLADTVLQTEAFIRAFYDLQNDKLKYI